MKRAFIYTLLSVALTAVLVLWCVRGVERSQEVEAVAEITHERSPLPVPQTTPQRAAPSVPDHARLPLNDESRTLEVQAQSDEPMTEDERARISGMIDAVIGETPATNAQRFAMLNELAGLRLTQEQTGRLLDYLGDADRYFGMNDAAAYVLMNELVAVFHDRDNLDDRYLSVSGSVIHNSEEDEVIRDYTLQGLSRGYQNATAEQATEIESIFWQSLKYTDTSLAGTSLLGINRIRSVRELTDYEHQQLQAAVMGIVKEPESGERARIPSIRIIAELQYQDAVPDLKQIFNSSNATLSEKVAALSALNALGDQNFVLNAQTSKHPLIVRAAQKLNPDK